MLLIYKLELILNTKALFASSAPSGPANMCKCPGPVKLERAAHASLDACFDALVCAAKDVTTLVGEDMALLLQPTGKYLRDLRSPHRCGCPAGIPKQGSNVEEYPGGAGGPELGQGGCTRARGCAQAHLHQGAFLCTWPALTTFLYISILRAHIIVLFGRQRGSVLALVENIFAFKARMQNLARHMPLLTTRPQLQTSKLPTSTAVVCSNGGHRLWCSVVAAFSLLTNRLRGWLLLASTRNCLQAGRVRKCWDSGEWALSEQQLSLSADEPAALPAAEMESLPRRYWAALAETTAKPTRRTRFAPAE